MPGRTRPRSQKWSVPLEISTLALIEDKQAGAKLTFVFQNRRQAFERIPGLPRMGSHVD
ncbi:MAG TPA: hypothetical protein VI320_17750 [Terracidiphilus sp.]|jgi:hypothetical protein